VRGSRTGIAVLLAAGVLAGCGSGSCDQPGLTRGQAQGLTAQLEAARVAAAAGDVAATQAALAKFRGSVTRLRRVGSLSDATARSLRVGAARVLQRVRSDSAPPPQPAATQPAPAPAPPPPKHEKKHEQKGHGKGKKHGHGGEGDG
jgi:hypothetical protein